MENKPDLNQLDQIAKEKNLIPQKLSYKKTKDIKISYPNDIIVTYSWSMVSHGICGHNFEAFELTSRLLKGNTPVKYLIPDTDQVAEHVKDALSTKYSNFNDIPIINGKPSFLVGGLVILCDGALPTKGVIHAKTLIMILCGKDFWWAKNIKMFTGDTLEIWYDERLGYDITGLVTTIHNYNPKLKIVLKGNYIKGINFELYKFKQPDQDPHKHNYLVYSTGNCRDIYLADSKYRSDTLKEIKDIINSTHTNILPQDKKLLILGWNPNYSIDEKMYFNKHKDQKIFNDRRLASIYADDTSEYFGIDVEVIPECDLPINNILSEFNTYIYTPTEKNWDCSSRLILECQHFRKEVILTPTAKALLPGNLGLLTRLQDAKIL